MSLTPVRVDFIGPLDRILQGTDWRRTVTLAQDMTGYNPALTIGAVLRGAVKSADRSVTYMSTAAGSMTLAFDNPTTLRIGFTAAGTSAAPAFADGVWDVEAVSGFTLLTERIAEGYAEMSREVTV